ncbi:MAG: MBL fold metallo-hydrolase [Candidatus Terrybacteria bacterium]|nr:MBL fold metallo-hydrolase [Candidatus Terrybacteria bacterium]
MEYPIWFKQSGFRFLHQERTIYIDPWDTPAGEEKADFILITHAHPDHFDPGSIERLQKSSTVILAPRDVAGAVRGGRIIAVGPHEERNVEGLHVETVPAYNIGKEYHPKNNEWVGYVIEVNGTRFYHAGDTDHIPEMHEVHTDVALLPIGGTFTMDAKEAAEAAGMIHPSVAIPMHYGFAAGAAKDGERFRDLAKVRVELLEPKILFAR